MSDVFDASEMFFEDEVDNAPRRRNRRNTTPVAQQIEQIEEQLGEEVDEEEFVDEDPTMPPANTDDTEIHPFDVLNGLVQRLNGMIDESNRRSLNEDPNVAPRWAMVNVAALRETRMTLKDILPKWEEWQSKRQEVEESWIEDLMDFNLQYIEENLGEDMIIDYMDKWEVWSKKD